jgi:hypothetical protein
MKRRSQSMGRSPCRFRYRDLAQRPGAGVYRPGRGLHVCSPPAARELYSRPLCGSGSWSGSCHRQPLLSISQARDQSAENPCSCSGPPPLWQCVILWASRGHSPDFLRTSLPRHIPPPQEQPSECPPPPSTWHCNGYSRLHRCRHWRSWP